MITVNLRSNPHVQDANWAQHCLETALAYARAWPEGSKQRERNLAHAEVCKSWIADYKAKAAQHIRTFGF